jgi:hypothetical protein
VNVNAAFVPSSAEHVLGAGRLTLFGLISGDGVSGRFLGACALLLCVVSLSTGYVLR